MGNFKDINQDYLNRFLSSKADDFRIADYPFRILTIPILKHIAANNDIRSSFGSVLATIRPTPLQYHPSLEVMRGDVLQFLRNISLENGTESVDNLQRYLESDLEILSKLERSRIPSNLLNYSSNEELRITVNRVYDLLNRDNI